MAPKSTEDWLRSIGSREHMEDRQARRQAREINAPIKSHGGIRGLAAIVRAKMHGRPHSLHCECESCAPALDMATVLDDRPDPPKKAKL